MKSKKWIIIGIISLLLITAELVVLLLWVLPGMKKNKALKALEDGDKAAAVELFEELGSSKTEDMKDRVKDIIVYKSNQCLGGSIQYDSFFKTMDAVEAVHEFRGMTADAFTAVNIPRLKQNYEDAIKAYDKDKYGADYSAKLVEYGNLRKCRLSDNETGLYYTWDDSQAYPYKELVEKTMDDCLKQKYDAYQKGTLDFEAMNSASEVAVDMWYSDYCDQVRSELRSESRLKEALSQAKAYYDGQEYWEAIDYIDNLRNDYGNNEVFSKWKERFDTMEQDAKDRAKTYYKEQAIQAAKDGNTDKAEDIIDELKERFGADFDVKDIEDNMHSDWQKAYVEYMKNWKIHLTGDLKNDDSFTKELSGDSVDLNKEEPKKIFLYDFDSDETPEMILASTTVLYILTYKDGKVVFTGAMQWLGLGDKPYIIGTFKINQEGNEATIEALLKLNGKEWDAETYVIWATDGTETRYAIGHGNDDPETVEEDAYNTAKAEIEGKIVTTTLAGGATIADAEKYINDYK